MDNVAYADREMEAEQILDEVWTTFEKRGVFCSRERSVQKQDLVTGLSSSSRSPTCSEPPSYDLLPIYDDVVNDLPPEYSALPPLAQRESTIYVVPTGREKSQSRSSSLLKDHMLDIRIDFEDVTGVREHKKKKPAAAAKKAAPAASPPPPPPPPAGGDGADDNANGDGGDAGGGAGGGNGDGGDGGGGGGDDWNDWNTSGKKDKKKEQEEEEERLAKEEEERKAAEASAANDLSWADDGGGGGGDDSWAGFADVGKKKKGKVTNNHPFFWRGVLSIMTGRSTPWRVPRYQSGQWSPTTRSEL